VHLNADNLIRVLESLASRGGYSIAAFTVGCSEQTLFNWINKSRKDADAGLKEKSPFWIEFRDVHDYWHIHTRHARMEQIQSIEGLIRQQVKEGVNEPVFSPATGYPLQAIDPRYIGISDDAMTDQFLHPVRDRFLWTEQDADGIRQPVGVFRNSVLAASLRAKVITGILPKIYGERVAIDHKVSGGVVHTYQPQAFVPRAERVQLTSSPVDAEFKEIAAPDRNLDPDIVELRRMAAKLSDPNRITKPEDATKVPIGRPVETAFRPTREDAGETTAHDAVRELPANKQPHTAMPQAPERPSYARKTDPHNPSNRAVKVG
jgi:hypothetical protein